MLRLVTFNILHGRSMEDGRVDDERLSRAIAGFDADVVCLQEVDHHQERSGTADQTASVARAMGAVAHRFAAAMAGTPGGTWTAFTGEDIPEGEPHYGIALLSRLPVHSWTVLRLPGAPLKAPLFVPGRRRPIMLEDEPRVAIAAEIEVGQRRMTVVTTHLSFVPGWNLYQLWRLQRALAVHHDPVVLAGDLNLPGRAVDAALVGWRRAVRDLPTFPAQAPRTQIDHVLVRGEQPTRVSVSAPAMPLSDHLPLVVDLEW